MLCVPCGCHHCWFCPATCTRKKQLEFYSPALRECRYSWGSPITLHAVGKTSGFEPGCHFLLQHRTCTNQISNWHLLPCVRLQLLFHLQSFVAHHADRAELALVWITTNSLSQFLLCFYNYSPFPSILNKLFGSFAKGQNELLIIFY